MQNKFSITFTAALTKCDRTGFEVDTKMDAKIVGEYSVAEIHQIAMQVSTEFGELLADHVQSAIKAKFSLD